MQGIMDQRGQISSGEAQYAAQDAALSTPAVIFSRPFTGSWR